MAIRETERAKRAAEVRRDLGLVNLTPHTVTILREGRDGLAAQNLSDSGLQFTLMIGDAMVPYKMFPEVP